MVVLNISNRKQFDSVSNGNDLLVVHFYANWADQCKIMNDVLEELSQQKGLNDVKFIKLLAEDFREISAKYNVNAVPTFILLRGSEMVDRIEGANAPELLSKVTLHCAASKQNATFKTDLNSWLKSLINSHQVMLFMKGTPQEPKCGFSKKMVTLLNEVVKDYNTFDILSDNEVREGLKSYSNWPTYPQLFVNGELVGGVDIVSELVSSGELRKMVNIHLEDRLKVLINKFPVMVFMKGDPNTPKCGFSKQIVDILIETKVPFKTFDILKDEDVRSGLKTFSRWPTYPQLYVKGHLVGGVDIVKELKDAQMLIQTLQPPT